MVHLFGSQQNRKERQRQDWVKEKSKSLKQWELDNSCLIKPVLSSTDSSLSADIVLIKMPEDLKKKYDDTSIDL